MKTLLLILTLSLSCFGQTGKRTTTPADAAAEKEISSIIQKLMDAIPAGDKAPWEKYVANDLIYTDENWKVLTKKDLLDSLKPLPKGYSGSIEAKNFRFRFSGDNAAAVVWDCYEEEFVFGQRLAPLYLVTDTYFKRNGQWQLVAEQITVRPSEQRAITVDAKIYQSLVGEYELAPGVAYKITVEDGKLTAQRTGRDKEEWLPLDVNTYFIKGKLRNQMVFIRDVSGAVVEIRDRRENNDLVWKRIKTDAARRPNVLTVQGSKNLGTADAVDTTYRGPANAPIKGTVGTDGALRGGILNGSAASLPPPAYPPAAKAVRSSGAVEVQVTIDESGKVVSAAAISGPALLRAAAESAARQATFAPTLLQGVPVKVTGIIIYNFIL